MRAVPAYQEGCARNVLARFRCDLVLEALREGGPRTLSTRYFPHTPYRRHLVCGTDPRGLQGYVGEVMACPGQSPAAQVELDLMPHASPAQPRRRVSHTSDYDTPSEHVSNNSLTPLAIQQT